MIYNMTETIAFSTAFVFLVLGLPGREVEGVRCFECNNYPSPAYCTDITTCRNDEDCYVEQIVTTGGRVVYNSGCISKDRCTALGGPRKKRNGDITTCETCCHGHLCNNQGCSKLAIPRQQRGPYCYKCDLMTNPDDCDKLTICATDQECILYVPQEFQTFPVPVYRADCESKDACRVLVNTNGRSSCPPQCCNTDFCNVRCGGDNTQGTTTLKTVVTTVNSKPTQTSPALSTTAKPTTSTASPTTSTTSPSTSTTSSTTSTASPTTSTVKQTTTAAASPTTTTTDTVTSIANPTTTTTNPTTTTTSPTTTTTSSTTTTTTPTSTTSKSSSTANSSSTTNNHIYSIGRVNMSTIKLITSVTTSETKHDISTTKPTTSTARPTASTSTPTTSTTKPTTSSSKPTTSTTKPTTSTIKPTHRPTRQPTTVDPHCPPPYHVIPKTRLCIWTVYQTKTWHDAKSFCQHHGGDLLLFKTDSERIAVYNYLRSTLPQHHVNDFWIGLHQYKSDDDDDRRDLGVNIDIYPGEGIAQTPNVQIQEDGSEERCFRVEFNNQLRNNDKGCGSHYEFICQKH